MLEKNKEYDWARNSIELMINPPIVITPKQKRKFKMFGKVKELERGLNSAHAEIASLHRLIESCNDRIADLERQDRNRAARAEVEKLAALEKDVELGPIKITPSVNSETGEVNFNLAKRYVDTSFYRIRTRHIGYFPTKAAAIKAAKHLSAEPELISAEDLTPVP